MSTTQRMVLFLFLEIIVVKGLEIGYYKKTCPRAEAVVARTTAQYISKAPSLVAPILRMHFHDCFVRGCDGSILLNSTKTNKGEKEAIPNKSLRGYQVIDAAKSALENMCPGVVSCADILTLVTRDAVAMIHGPYWNVPTGRRDGKVSSASEPSKHLPSPFADIKQLKKMFAAKGLNSKDLVVLSGAHTIGTSRCPTFSNRLYNFTGKGDTDPTLDPKYALELKKKCKKGDVSTLVEMDPGSFRTFDQSYYNLVSKRRGMFESDAALLHDRETRAYVKIQATKKGSIFYRDFAESMVKMGKIGVLTSQRGEIRRHCAFVNS